MKRIKRIIREKLCFLRLHRKTETMSVIFYINGSSKTVPYKYCKYCYAGNPMVTGDFDLYDKAYKGLFYD